MGIFAVFLLVILLSPLVWVVVVYNRFITQKNRVAEAVSAVDVLLKRRHDLIPLLVATVKGYSDHEVTAFVEVIKQRGAVTSVDDLTQESGRERNVTAAFKSLFALAEQYPELKAAANYLSLQKELVATEELIQYARRYFNGTVRDMNIMVDSFPSMIIARAFSFPPYDFFEIELATQRSAPEIKIS